MDAGSTDKGLGKGKSHTGRTLSGHINTKTEGGDGREVISVLPVPLELKVWICHCPQWSVGGHTA